VLQGPATCKHAHVCSGSCTQHMVSGLPTCCGSGSFESIMCGGLLHAVVGHPCCTCFLVNPHEQRMAQQAQPSLSCMPCCVVLSVLLIACVRDRSRLLGCRGMQSVQHPRLANCEFADGWMPWGHNHVPCHWSWQCLTQHHTQSEYPSMGSMAALGSLPSGKCTEACGR
jgi:hypothetical protein